MFDPALWHRGRRFGPLKGIALDEAGLTRYVVASRICPDHGCHHEWVADCPVCRTGLELAQMVAKAAGQA